MRRVTFASAVSALMVMCLLLMGCGSSVGTSAATPIATATKPAMPTQDIVSELTPQMQMIMSNPNALTKLQQDQRRSYIDNLYGELTKRISTFRDSIHPLILGIHTQVEVPTVNGPKSVPGVSMSGGEGGYGVLVKIPTAKDHFESALAFPISGKYGDWELVHISKQKSAYIGDYSQTSTGATGGSADYNTVLDTNNGHVVMFELLTNPNEASGISSNSGEVADNREIVAYLTNPQQYLAAHNNQKPPVVLSSSDLTDPSVYDTLPNAPTIDFRYLTAYI